MLVNLSGYYSVYILIVSCTKWLSVNIKITQFFINQNFRNNIWKKVLEVMLKVNLTIAA